MKLTHYFPILIVATIFSCVKPPDYPIEPVIEFERMSRNTMFQGNTNTDSVVVTISFTDGDGDLGSNDGTMGIFLKDTRFEGDPRTFIIPFVPVQGVGNGISGEIEMWVQTTCCICEGYDPCDMNPQALIDCPTDTMTYEIYIVDRAGHESNRILTDPIILQCDVN